MIKLMGIIELCLVFFSLLSFISIFYLILTNYIIDKSFYGIKKLFADDICGLAMAEKIFVSLKCDFFTASSKSKIIYRIRGGKLLETYIMMKKEINEKMSYKEKREKLLSILDKNMSEYKEEKWKNLI